MEKENFQPCEVCGYFLPQDTMVFNDDLELVCKQCLEEKKRDKRVSTMLFFGCVFIAILVVFFIFKSFQN